MARTLVMHRIRVLYSENDKYEFVVLKSNGEKISRLDKVILKEFRNRGFQKCYSSSVQVHRKYQSAVSLVDLISGTETEQKPLLPLSQYGRMSCVAAQFKVPWEPGKMRLKIRSRDKDIEFDPRVFDLDRNVKENFPGLFTMRFRPSVQFHEQKHDGKEMPSKSKCDNKSTEKGPILLDKPLFHPFYGIQYGGDILTEFAWPVKRQTMRPETFIHEEIQSPSYSRDESKTDELASGPTKKDRRAEKTSSGFLFPQSWVPSWAPILQRKHDGTEMSSRPKHDNKSTEKSSSSLVKFPFSPPYVGNISIEATKPVKRHSEVNEENIVGKKNSRTRRSRTGLLLLPLYETQLCLA